MQNRFSYKIAFIIGLMVFLMIPQTLLEGLISERISWRHHAEQSILQSWPGPQTLSGPVISVPYEVTALVTEKIKGSAESVITREVTTLETAYLLPTRLAIHGKLDTSLRSRGIYEVPIYSSALHVSGEFSTQALSEIAAMHKDKQIRWKTPVLSVLVNDQRGIASSTPLEWNGGSIPFTPGSALPEAGDGMHAKLPTMLGESLPFAFDLDLRGMRSVQFAQLAENTDLRLSANWPHPSFCGNLLPETRDIDSAGFSAQWKTSAFSSNLGSVHEQLQSGHARQLLNRGVGVNLVQPVDVYQQTQRCIKYALLFLILTFGFMVLFELLKSTPLHPVQYAFVGFALMIFYLLLVSLSERISFLWAYAAASTACTGLLTCYFGSILRSWKLGLILGAGLLALYSILYVILQAEDNALIMGSVLLFTVLAALMISTRHFDWYALTGSRTAAVPPAPEK